MKKLLLCLIIVLGLLPSVALAQKKTVEHLKFLGIPICGSVENFGKQLEEKGFIRINEKDLFIGLWDNDSVMVMLSRNERLNLVYSVDIVTDAVPTAEKMKLESRFKDYVSRFEMKYDRKSETINDTKVIPVYKNSNLIGVIEVAYTQLDDETAVLVRYVDFDGLNKNQKENDKDL